MERHRQLDARAAPGLGVDAGEVHLDGLRAEVDPLGDLAVRQPPRDVRGDLRLDGGEQGAGGRTRDRGVATEVADRERHAARARTVAPRRASSSSAWRRACGHRRASGRRAPPPRAASSCNPWAVAWARAACAAAGPAARRRRRAGGACRTATAAASHGSAWSRALAARRRCVVAVLGGDLDPPGEHGGERPDPPEDHGVPLGLVEQRRRPDACHPPASCARAAAVARAMAVGDGRSLHVEVVTAAARSISPRSAWATTSTGATSAVSWSPGAAVPPAQGGGGRVEGPLEIAGAQVRPCHGRREPRHHRSLARRGAHRRRARREDRG